MECVDADGKKVWRGGTNADQEDHDREKIELVAETFELGTIVTFKEPYSESQHHVSPGSEG